jgi:hypothetical protein
MLAVCSDLDETPDRHVYREIMRFLNTTETTAMGPGMGLEVGNTIYFDMPPDQFAYWNTDDAGQAMVRDLIRSGHIDCLHSYGDLATTRAHATRALEELDRHGCRLEVWIDHGTAPANFGADIMRGHGDEPGHEVYHADQTCAFGVQYVWRGRVTSVIGQDVPPSLGGLLTRRAPLASMRTVAKEAAKRWLARGGNARYAMHASNEVLRRTTLRNGTPVYEFLRSNPHWGGVSSCDTGREIGRVLTEDMLDYLACRGGVCILYTHLGKIRDSGVPFGEAAVAAFRRLANEYQNGRILVTTTRRLLGFCRTVREVNWCVTVSEIDGKTEIALSIEAPVRNGALTTSDLDGLTFYVSDPEATRVTLDGRQVTVLHHNDPDHTGRRSVSLPWPRLEFPSL